MRFIRLPAGLALLSLMACSNLPNQMPRGSLEHPELVPEVVLHPGVLHWVGSAKHQAKVEGPLAVCDDPKIVEFEEVEDGVFAIGLKPGRAQIRHPHEAGNLATNIRVEAPELIFPERNDIPRYLRGQCNAATFAEAVNHYVRMGEARACRELIETRKLCRTLDDYFARSTMDHPISDLCRVLFQGTPEAPLRGAGLGAAMLPYQSMPRTTWPLLPIAEHDGVFLNLSVGFTVLAGARESVEDYIRYCRKEGTFRKRPLKVPSRAEARAAVEALFRSERWINLREEAARRDEPFSEAFMQEGIRFQARSIY